MMKINTTLFVANVLSMIIICLIDHVESFSHVIPKLNSKNTGNGSAIKLKMSAITEGDIVTVFGATGGIGSVVTKRLIESRKYKVRALVRDPSKAKEIFGEDSSLEFVQGNLLNGDGLEDAIKDANAIVCCTGTTAYPTQKWKGGNTPINVDKIAIEELVSKCKGAPSLKRFALLTSIGVERADSMPFKILNAFGVLDFKKAGESAVIEGSKQCGYDYLIVRPGQLVGGEPSNFDFESGFKFSLFEKRSIILEQGDTLVGNLDREDAAEIIFQGLRLEEAGNKVFAAINGSGKSPPEDFWKLAFQQL
mmetsp:Transcript_11075/g.13906  ORF Transcript_11075/g.13906 Transcript_11075/m.13906 type:complete len:307 (+) Transcript_11075:98-1018(+)